MQKYTIAGLLLTSIFELEAQSPLKTTELNTLLMHSTFLISGPGSAPDSTSLGTVFVLGVPLKADPKRAAYALVTAAHVLDGIAADTAEVHMRIKQDDGTYSPFPISVPIKKDGKPVYTKHPSADVAAMFIAVPNSVPMSLLPTNLLVEDKTIEDLEIHPGDEAFCLGFPLAAATPGMFPILRTGRIASYPLTPSSIVKSIIFDLFIYPGNSGGPVYYIFDGRFMKGGTHIGRWVGILGLVIQQQNSNLPGFKDKPLNLGVIVPAHLIRETIEMLPKP